MNEKAEVDFEELDDAALMEAFNTGKVPSPVSEASEEFEQAAPETEKPVEEPVESENGESQEELVPEESAETVKDGEKVSSEPDATPHQTEANQPDQEKPEEAPDYESLYSQIMAPFKANGREFKPENPEEAIKLMRLGANYTKKMQQLAPNIRLMRMLENNDLLSEEKISFLIDLTQKNPGAIQKLLKEGNIDPLDVNVTEEVNYKPGNHRVSDQEIAFSEALNSITETDTGKETIRHINSDWDRESQAVLYREPALLEVINTQRANGIYDRISAEIARQRTLGNLANVPFIQAYHTVGARMQEAGLLAPTNTSAGQQNTVRKAQETVLDRRAEPVRKPMSNGDKARAASPPAKTSPAKKTELNEFSPFSMSDEEVMRLTNSRF